MPTLHLGVLDVAYSDGGKSTGDIAEILEEKYHVMENFFQLHESDIAQALEQSIGDKIQDMLNGAPIGGNSMAAAMADIQTLFNRFIDSKEMDGLGYPGVPTKASLLGVNHRMKHPYAKRGPRPSFRDTGTYEGAFRSWIEE